MFAGSPPAQLGLDPLIAEAKQRARRRRALALALLVVIVAAAAGMYFALRGPSRAPLGGNSATGSSGPFFDYGIGSYGAAGFMGDHDGAATGTTLGCINGRHYEEGGNLENRSHTPVTILSAQWRSSAPRIIQWAATQVRLTPNRHAVVTIGTNWSGRSTAPVTIPPHRIASLQFNFIFRHCGQLAGGRRVAGLGSLIVRYRASGRVRQQVSTSSGQGFVVVAGPRRQTCAPASGSTRLIASNLSCAAARQAALACRLSPNKDFRKCAAGNALWLCEQFVGHDRPHNVETCHQEKTSRLETTLPHGFRVRWTPPA